MGTVRATFPIAAGWRYVYAQLDFIRMSFSER